MQRGEKLETIQAYGLAAAGLLKGVYNVYIHPEQPSTQSAELEVRKSATLGWAAIVGGVFAWDMLAPETLSEGVDRALERHKLLTSAAVGTTALHLLNALPEPIDPIHQFGKRARTMFRGV